jgi:hypothetical protein
VLEHFRVSNIRRLRRRSAEELAELGISDSDVAEIRRAMTAQGLALTGEPLPLPNAIADARRAGRAAGLAAARAVARPRRRPEKPPTSPEDFAALVKDLRAELKEADPQQREHLLNHRVTPASFTGRPWAWARTGPDGMAAITGYAASTLRVYISRSQREHDAGKATERTMPARGMDGTWNAGDLALWMATANEAKAAEIRITTEEARDIQGDVAAARARTKRVPYSLYAALAERYDVSVPLIRKIAAGQYPAETRRGPTAAREERREHHLLPLARDAWERAGGTMTPGALAKAIRVKWETAQDLMTDLRREDDEISAFALAEITRSRRRPTETDLLEAAQAAGLRTSPAQVGRLLPAIRSDAIRRQHPFTGQERGIGESMRGDGLLTAGQVAYDWGITPATLSMALRRGEVISAGKDHGRRLYDPRRLRARTDKPRGPVDVTHPKARLEPGDPGYKGGTGR